MGSTSVQTAYSRTSLSCLHCFMMLASSKNASLDIVPGFSVLMATSVVLFHFPDKIRHRENSNFLHVWIIWLGIDVTKHVLDTSVHFPIHGWKISNKAFRLHSGFNSLSLNSLSLKRILISLNNICCFMFADKTHTSVKYSILTELKKLLSWSIGTWYFFQENWSVSILVSFSHLSTLLQTGLLPASWRILVTLWGFPKHLCSD